MDPDSFVAGYRAALRDLNMGRISASFGIAYDDPEGSARRALEDPDWMREAARVRAEADDELAEERRRNAPATPAKTGTVYLLYNAEGRRWKIGWTGGDPERRRRAIESAAGTEVQLVATMPGTRTDEGAIHFLLASERLVGEWFRDSEKVRQWIARQTEVAAA
jgi:hypothetical protein